MAEAHATISSTGQETTPLAISGNFSVTVNCTTDWDGTIVLEKKFIDRTEQEEVFVFEQGTQNLVGTEPGATAVEYKFRCIRRRTGSAYVRIEDGN